MSRDQDSEPGKDFKLERYKYILQQIHTLNENLYRYLALFQTLATAIVGGGVAVLVSWQNLKVSAEVARVGIRGLLGLLIILTLFLIINVIIGVLSWFDYRQDEVKLLDEVIGSQYRKLPKAGNWWRWYETYFVIFLILVMIAVYTFTQTQVIPLIK
jgi:hypothetical protein